MLSSSKYLKLLKGLPEANRVRWADLPLRIKLIFPVVIFNCIVAVAIFFTVWRNSTEQLEYRLRNDAELYAHTVRCATGSMKDVEELRTFLRTIGKKKKINFIALLDISSGRILEATDSYTRAVPEIVIPFWGACLAQMEKPDSSEAWIHFSKHQLQYVSPIASGRSGALLEKFCVIIAMDTTKTRTQVFIGARRLALVTLVVLTALSLAIISLLHFIVVKRINQVISATPKSADELLEYENPLDGLDEISRLSRSVTRAYRSLGGSFQRLKDFAGQLETTGHLADVGSWRIELNQSDVAQCPLSWCGQTRQIFGLRSGNSTTLHELLRHFTPKSRPLVLSSFQAAAKSGFPIDLDLPIITPDQEERWIRLVGSVKQIEDEAVAISGAVQDITQHSTMLRSALSESRKQRSLLTSAGAGLWTWTPQTGQFEIAKEWRRKIKLPVVKSFSEFLEFVHPEDRQKLEHFHAPYAHAQKYSTELRIQAPDGWLMSQWHGCASKKDSDGNITEVSGLVVEFPPFSIGA